MGVATTTECPVCRAENPLGAAFCASCGTAVALRCPACQNALAPGARFCTSCGTPLEESAGSVVRMSQLTGAIPRELALKMREARHEGERKVVSILFADVVGSTPIAERLDPEAWGQVINLAYERVAPAIYRYEGTIAQILGDGLLVFFGAPVAHEDDPVRAVRAALDFLTAVDEVAPEIAARYGVEFAMRVGVNTGLVVVGDVGNDLRYEYLAVGDAVNLAARMESAARPMTVMISANTHRFVSPLFDFHDLGMLEVKGKTEAVRAYEAVGTKSEPGPVRGLAGLESPMVGRNVELAELLELCAAVGQGRGGVATILGDPGIGKTRLLAECHARVAGSQASRPASSPPRWIEAHCLSYGRKLAYHPIVGLLRSLVGMSMGAEDQDTRRALLVLLEDLLREGLDDVWPYLVHLMSLELEESEVAAIRGLDPQGLQVQYLAALGTVLRRLSERQPVVAVVEDLHWADATSAELLAKLLPVTLEVPLLFCFTARPDQEAPGWKLIDSTRSAGVDTRELVLGPLSSTESGELMGNLMGIEVLPDEVRSLILARSEGNPFFLEELVRMLIERQAIARENGQWVLVGEIDREQIPETLQGLLLARIDRLPEDVRHTLRVASVIGRRFPVRLLEEVLSG